MKLIALICLALSVGGEVSAQHVERSPRPLAAPANGPKEYHSVQEILESIPAAIEPSQADHWTEVQVKVVNEWLAKNVVSQKCALPLVVENVTKAFEKGQEGQWMIRSTVRMKTPSYILVFSFFPATAEAKLVKVEKDQHITIGGTISKFQISGSGSISLMVEISDCDIK